MIDAAILKDVASLQRVSPIWLRYRRFWEDVDEIRSRIVDKDKHLTRGWMEPSEEFETRKKLTRFVPETPVALAQVCGAVCADQPDRSELPEALKSWATHVDHRGQSMGAWMERVLTPTRLLYGTANVLLDPPRAPEGAEVRTRDDQQKLGILEPRLAVYTPLPVRNWEWNGDLQELEWVLIYEETSRLGGPLGVRVPQRVYRLFDRTHWHVVRTEPHDPSRGFSPMQWDEMGESRNHQDEKIVEEPQVGNHGSPGRVPLIPVMGEQLEEIVGESFVAAAVELDFKRLIHESDHTYSLHFHSHQQLAIRSREQPKDIGLGVSKYIHLQPKDASGEGEEDAFYLQPSAEAFQALEREIRRCHVDARRQLGADPRAIYSDEQAGRGQAESGVSRIVAYRTSEGRHVGAIRDAMEHSENQIYRLAAEFLGISLEDGPLVEWPRQSSDDPLSDAVTALADSKSSVRSPTFKREAEKRIATAVLGDGLDPVLRQKINQEIDTMEEPKPLLDEFGENGFASDDEEDVES